MISILAYIGAVAVLVVFHELGHYWVARRCDVKVLRFSVGFGKVLYSRRFGNGETEWAISAVPLGGYVKMLDEREGEVAANELSRAFNRKPVLQRMAIVAAGPVANLLLAIILYFALFTHGVPGIKPVLGDVEPNTPAGEARLQARETILSVDGVTAPSWEEVQWTLLNRALERGQVEIVGRTADGVQHQHSLGMSGLVPSDLDGDFMQKLGLKLYRPPIPPVIDSLLPGGAGERAGLRPGDTVLRVNGQEITTFEQWAEVVHAHPKVTLHLDLLRDGHQLPLDVTPDEIQTDGGKTIGLIGAAPRIDEKTQKAFDAMLTEVSYSPLPALGQALHKTWDISALSLKMIWRMIKGEVSLKNLSGPVRIADYAGQSAHYGMVAYVTFLALISVSLGVLNFLPVPVLDGGYLLYYMAELVMRRPVPERAWEVGQKIGLVLLLSLMTLALYNDISSYNGISAAVSRLITR